MNNNTGVMRSKLHGEVCQRSALVDNLDDPIKIKSTDSWAILISHKWLRAYFFATGLRPGFCRYQNQILMFRLQQKRFLYHQISLGFADGPLVTVLSSSYTYQPTLAHFLPPLRGSVYSSLSKSPIEPIDVSLDCGSLGSSCR